ncbi:MAG TPA: MMPL family transporter, partial [Polyangiaceae bacterium]
MISLEVLGKRSRRAHSSWALAFPKRVTLDRENSSALREFADSSPAGRCTRDSLGELPPRCDAASGVDNGWRIVRQAIMLEALGRFVHRRRWLVLLGTGALLVVAVLMLARGGHLTGGTIRDLEAERAQLLVEEVIGHPPDSTWIAVFRAVRADLDEAALRAAVGRALEPLRSHPSVLAISAPGPRGSQHDARMVDVPARSAFALITLKGTPKEALHAYPEVRALLRSESLAIACTGRVPFLHDLGVTLAHDVRRAELLALPLALLVLLVVFRTVVAAVLPVVVGAFAVVGGLAIVLGISRHTDIAEYTVSVCSLIGLGVAIDYSLFIVSRYREELAAGRDYPQALARAVGRAGRVVA